MPNRQSDPSGSESSAQLRRRAEARLSSREAALPDDVEASRLIHELQVHQVELQLQNDELQRSQTELRAARDRYFHLYDGAPVGFVTVNDTGFVRQVNRTFCQLLDGDPTRLRGRPLADLVHPDDRAAFLARFRALFRSPADKAPELRLCREDGASVWVRLQGRRLNPDTAAGVDGRDGDAELLVSVSDITTSREAEQRGRALEEQVRRAQKLESLGLLAGGIAHDFNNLLMAVMGNCDLALWSLAEQHPARANVEQTLKAAQHASDLCRQLLAYAGRGSLQQRDCELRGQLQHLLPMLRVMVGPATHLEIRSDDPEVWIEADQGQLQQLITNLVVNAAESYAAAGGRVTVTAGRRIVTEEELGRATAPHEMTPGPVACLEVSDAGRGMDSVTVTRLFDPFFSTKFTGRGLGMAVVLGVVRGHGGCVLVDSAPGRGTRITVLLPLREKGEAPPPVADDETGTQAPQPHPERPLALLIDDDDEVRRVGVQMLRALGYEPIAAADGPTGLEHYRRLQGRIAVVILDLVMPDMDGVAVFRRLRRLDPACRVAVITGYHEEKVADSFRDEAPDATILKPFRLEELGRTLAEVAAR